MKVILLAGGFGTRLSEYTKTIPKPMVRIGNKPIIHHIIDYYAKYNFTELLDNIDLLLSKKNKAHY